MAGLREVIEQEGLFSALYSDRGSHFWHTPKAGGKVEAERLTQVGHRTLSGPDIAGRAAIVAWHVWGAAT